MFADSPAACGLPQQLYLAPPQLQCSSAVWHSLACLNHRFHVLHHPTCACHALQAKRVTKGIWNTTTRTLLSLYWAQLLYHSFWVAIEVGVR